MSAEVFLVIGAIAGWSLLLGFGAFICEKLFEEK